MKQILVFIAFIASFYIVFVSDNTNLIGESTDINLVGLNTYDSSSLIKLKQAFEKLGFSCQIKNSIETEYNEFLFQPIKSQIELGKNDYFSYNSSKPITIYVTSSELVNENVGIRGICFGNEIYVQNSDRVIEASVHELLHSFGLEHCENDCIMNSHSPNRWNYTTDRPNFCDNCRVNSPL